MIISSEREFRAADGAEVGDVLAVIGGFKLAPIEGVALINNDGLRADGGLRRFGLPRRQFDLGRLAILLNLAAPVLAEKNVSRRQNGGVEHT